MTDLMKKFDKTFGATKKAATGAYGRVGGDRTVDDQMMRRGDRWNFLFIAGMWFQDLFNYDFRRTERCIIPYATQEGEISFCAYNTGIGWRNIIEKMHMTATLTKWYDEHGRHQIYAGGKNVDLSETSTTWCWMPTRSRRASRRTSTTWASPRTRAKRSCARARSKSTARKSAEDEKMAALYRQHVLKEQAPEPVIKIAGLGGKKKPVQDVVHNKPE